MSRDLPTMAQAQRFEGDQPFPDMTEFLALQINETLRGAHVRGQAPRGKFEGIFLGINFGKAFVACAFQGEVVIETGVGSHRVIGYRAVTNLTIIGPPRERCYRCWRWMEPDESMMKVDGLWEHIVDCLDPSV